MATSTIKNPIIRSINYTSNDATIYFAYQIEKLVIIGLRYDKYTDQTIISGLPPASVRTQQTLTNGGSSYGDATIEANGTSIAYSNSSGSSASAKRCVFAYLTT